MANEAVLANSVAPAASNEEEYQTFCAALSASARGRAFLAEYARRHRGADTEVMLAALARLEAVIRAQRSGAEPARAELRALIEAIRAARPELAARSLPARAARLAQLVDMLERRLEALLEPAAPAAIAPIASIAAVPPPDEPELPIPSPTAVEPALTLAHDNGPPPAAQAAPETGGSLMIPEVTWLDGAPPEPSQPIETPAAVMPVTPTLAEKVAALAEPAPLPAAPQDPLAPLLRLTARERLALFT